MKYPLPACSFTPKEGRLVTRKIYKRLLPELGANRNFPLIWRHAPTSLQGLDLPDTYLEQGIEHVKTLLTIGDSTSITGRLLKASLEAAQLERGLDHSVLACDFATRGHLLTHNTLVHAMALSTQVRHPD
jgi:hypothetical protein